MATVTLKGNPIHTVGELPGLGTPAPAFRLAKTDLSDVGLDDFPGVKILNIFPSVDTGTCAASVRRFNQAAATLNGVTVLCVSADLPFAQKRFCGAEGIDNVVMLSTVRDASFGEHYGVRLVDGPLAGLLARSVVVLDPSNRVTYTQLVPETGEEPDYDAVLAALKA